MYLPGIYAPDAHREVPSQHIQQGRRSHLTYFVEAPGIQAPSTSKCDAFSSLVVPTPVSTARAAKLISVTGKAVSGILPSVKGLHEDIKSLTTLPALGANAKPCSSDC